MYYALSMMFYAMQQDRAMKRREQALEYLCVGGGRDGVGGGGMNGVGGESAELKAKLAEMQRKMEQMSQMHHDKRQQEQVIFFIYTKYAASTRIIEQTHPEI